MSVHRFAIAATIVLSFIVAAGAEPPTPAARTEAVVLRAGAPQTLAMKSGKPIRSARSANDALVQVAPNEPDVKTVQLRGLRPGACRLTLTDTDGGEESILVAVEGEITAAALEVRPKLVKAMQEALKNESDAAIRLQLAEGLIRVAPEDTAAARELVEALASTSDTLPADAYLAIGRLLSESPPALVAALTPLLRSRDDVARRRAIVLLLKVDPKALP